MKIGPWEGRTFHIDAGNVVTVRHFENNFCVLCHRVRHFESPQFAYKNCQLENLKNSAILAHPVYICVTFRYTAIKFLP
jgi:hypothetical protein